MQKSRPLIQILSVATAGLMLIAMATASVARAAEPFKFAFGALPIGAFPVQVMQEQGLDKKNNFDIKLTVFPTVQGFYAGAHPIFIGIPEMSNPGKVLRVASN